ncbi:molybdenum cofactor guanylyltransferase [Deinococcus radiomollis]|uniref:molybdenum cofactor guanylyltransferase n=1 Tax=Deinococcus radiomollis TaxID=468916 RepID=UPI0038927953
MKSDGPPAPAYLEDAPDRATVDHGVALGAAITAGGQSRRFGRDKALYAVQGVPLLHRVAASLEESAPKLLIAPAGRYALPGWTTRPDLRPGEGPLAGLETALSVLAGAPAPQWLAFAAVDLPNLTVRYWRLLAGQIVGDSARPVVRAVLGLDDRQRAQPLAGLYHVSLLPQVTALLDAGERRMQALLEHLTPGEAQGTAGSLLVSSKRVEAVCPGAYLNLNTPPP